LRLPPILRQGKRHIRSTRWRPELASARGDHYKLPPVGLVHGGGGIAGSRKGSLPKQFTGGFVENVELPVAVCGANKEETAGCHHRSTIVLAAGVAHSLFRQLRVLAEGDSPRDLAGVEVNRVQGAPGRLDCRITVRVEELVIAVIHVLLFYGPRTLADRLDAPILAREQVSYDRILSFRRHLGKTRHAPVPLPDDGFDLLATPALADIHECGKLGRTAFQVL